MDIIQNFASWQMFFSNQFDESICFEAEFEKKSIDQRCVMR